MIIRLNSGIFFSVAITLRPESVSGLIARTAAFSSDHLSIAAHDHDDDPTTPTSEGIGMSTRVHGDFAESVAVFKSHKIVLV